MVRIAAWAFVLALIGAAFGCRPPQAEPEPPPPPAADGNSQEPVMTLSQAYSVMRALRDGWRDDALAEEALQAAEGGLAKRRLLADWYMSRLRLRRLDIDAVESRMFFDEDMVRFISLYAQDPNGAVREVSIFDLGAQGGSAWAAWAVIPFLYEKSPAANQAGLGLGRLGGLAPLAVPHLALTLFSGDVDGLDYRSALSLRRILAFDTPEDDDDEERPGDALIAAAKRWVRENLDDPDGVLDKLEAERVHAARPAPDALVQVSLAGTDIRRLPDMVLIVSEDPEEDERKMLAEGGRKPPHRPHPVVFRGVPYVFRTPDFMERHFYGIIDGFEASDVVYYFLLDSEAEAEAFANQHWLKYAGILFAAKIYGTSRLGYYVLTPVWGSAYVCPAHPEMVHKEEGACQECGAELVPWE